MPPIDKADRRDKKKFKERYGMRVAGRSLKSVILPLIWKKAKEARDKKNG